LSCNNPAFGTLKTENNCKVKRVAEERKSPRMAKVHNFLERWQCSQTICAMQEESHTQNKNITATGYISDTAEIIKAFCTNGQLDGVAGFELPERPPLPPVSSATTLPGRRTQLINVY